MKARLAVVMLAASVAFVLANSSSALLGAQGHADLALTGTVVSAEDGAMEGVLISARRAGSTLTTTVVSDHDGRYRFPAAKLEPGQYSVAIRAIGYDLARETTVSIGQARRRQPTCRFEKPRTSPRSSPMPSGSRAFRAPRIRKRPSAVARTATCSISPRDRATTPTPS